MSYFNGLAILETPARFCHYETVKVIGLTGGIATGKSTVASLLLELGAEIIDADELAREVVQPDQDAWREIVGAFGRKILRKDKTIDREKLRKIVFEDREARDLLESILHPRIRALAEQRIHQRAAAGAEIIIYEAPLFFEKKAHLWIRPVILVVCDPAIQRQRLRERDRLSELEIQQHLKAQMSMDEKRKLADYLIENNGDMEELKRRVQTLWAKLKKNGEGVGSL